MKISILMTLLFPVVFLMNRPEINEETGFSLTIEVKNLRNSNGRVQFALYNKDGSIPDEEYIHYYKITNGDIANGSSRITFNKLPKGTYAVNILHDEDSDGKIKKGLILPKEGIGFSNFQSIGLGNKPTFSKASFHLEKDLKISVHIIYL
ncbi:MAG: DUF2141 domain-containing protein [Bacteroidota bacterium]|jgi:uncharacterized protein (DUF2141 family)